MKRSVRFSDDTKRYDGQGNLLPVAATDGGGPSKKKRLEETALREDVDEGDGVERFERDKKHTLDSDEEYEEENYKKLDMRKVDGQEDATQEYDGDIKLMAFNMKEDLEDGHFDSGGNFIYNKKEPNIKDAWLDNIDWDNVKNQAGKQWNKTLEEEDEADADEGGADVEAIYNRLLEILNNDKETVANALKRMNSEKGLSAAEERKRRWATKKAGLARMEDPNNKAVSELTSLADSLISIGHMDAYELNPPKIKALLRQ